MVLKISTRWHTFAAKFHSPLSYKPSFIALSLTLSMCQFHFLFSRNVPKLLHPVYHINLCSLFFFVKFSACLLVTGHITGSERPSSRHVKKKKTVIFYFFCWEKAASHYHYWFCSIHWWQIPSWQCVPNETWTAITRLSLTFRTTEMIEPKIIIYKMVCQCFMDHFAKRLFLRKWV